MTINADDLMCFDVYAVTAEDLDTSMLSERSHHRTGYFVQAKVVGGTWDGSDATWDHYGDMPDKGQCFAYPKDLARLTITGKDEL